MQRPQALIISHHQGYGDSLKIVLDFIGQASKIISVVDFEAYTGEESRPLCIILEHQPTHPQKNQHLIKIANQLFPNVPLLTVGETYEESNPLIFATLLLPIAQGYLLQVLHRCQLVYRMHQSNQPSLALCHETSEVLVGESRAITEVRYLISQVADSDVTVLILGESGTGKELVAKCLHRASRRRDHAFIPVNCGAIPAELLESELFGHEKGAFTGAYAVRKGRFEMAEKGCIFLDEIGDMPLGMQVKFLRVLQERQFERVGSSKVLEADVRIIAATHRNLEKAISEGHFREDLFYRLNVFPIEMPALRHRIEDLPVLINDLTTRLSYQLQCSLCFTSRAISALSQYTWPGNIRELANLLERLMVLFPNGIVDVDDLPAKYQMNTSSEASKKNTPYDETEDLSALAPPSNFEGFDLKEHMMNTELAFIKQALAVCDGVVARAANYLHMRRTTLVEKMRKYGIQRPDMEIATTDEAELA